MNVLVNDASLTDIANAIRSKLNTSDTYKPGQMAGAIQSIPTGGGAVLGTKSIAANGTYNASSDGYDGYSQVDVNVPNTYTSSDEGKVVSNGYLIEQFADTVTMNGTWDTTYIKSLTVNVSGGGGNAYVSGSFTPSSRVNDVTIDVGSAMTVSGIVVVPHSESPLKNNGKTCVGLLLTPNAYYKAIGITSNNAGGSLLAPASLTSGSAFTQSGSSITLRPTGVTGFAAGQFETIQYDWIVW